MRGRFWVGYITELVGSKNRVLKIWYYPLFAVDNLYERIRLLAGVGFGRHRYMVQLHMWKRQKAFHWLIS